MDKPKIIVFDLDATLWPFHVNLSVQAPITKKDDGTVLDANGYRLCPFPEVPTMLKQLQKEGYRLAAASRTTNPDNARDLIKMLDWDKFFTHKEIYPGRKTEHLKKIREHYGVAYKDMLFFDDEYRNIIDAARLGVASIYVKEHGMNWATLEEGLMLFSQNAKRPPLEEKEDEPSPVAVSAAQSLTAQSRASNAGTAV